MWIKLARFCLRMAGCSRDDIDKSLEHIECEYPGFDYYAELENLKDFNKRV